ncbi:MAG: DUF1501 domain-containing protein [bacterium]|nr:DUF1501 domain-containing protein [bacterium]
MTERNPIEDACNLISRRKFLAGLGAAVTVAACSNQGISVYQQADTVSGAYQAPGALAPSSLPTPPRGTVPVTDRTLVVIELGGGNDSLSTIVPLNSRYRDLRPTTAIEDPIRLDGDVGLHPALTTVADRYSSGQVAIVEGLGIPNPDLSHFVSMRRWWDGTSTPDHTGWLGRYLDASVGYEHILAGISVGPGPSQALLGSASYVVGISDTNGLASGFPWWVDDPRDFAGVWSGFAPAHIPVSELDPVRKAIAATATAQNRLQRSLQPLQDALDAIEVDTYSIEGQLALAGALIASDVDPRVIYVHGNSDFDTHENQQYRHGELMGQLDRGLNHLFAIVEAAGMEDRVVAMTASEFGRRPEDNDGGTDHGTASSHLVIGPRVAGGRYGETPSLSKLDEDGNLVHTVDYRSLYASVLDGWLGAGHQDILHDQYETLPIFNA